MSVVIRLKVPIEMHYAVIPMGTSTVNSSANTFLRYKCSAFTRHTANFYRTPCCISPLLIATADAAYHPKKIYVHML